MKVPNWRELVLSEEVLAEPNPGSDRIILWLTGRHDGGMQHWERISTVASAAITVAGGMCAIPATSVRARQRVRTLLGKLLHPFQQASQEQAWILPNGQSAEQEGQRQTDLLLVWPEREAPPLDEARIRSRWPGSTRVEKLGDNLFLVCGVNSPGPSPDEPAQPLPQGCPRKQVEQLLAAARASGDPRKKVLALADLGIISARESNARSAVALLEEALALARRLGDKTLERDILGNLGVAQLGMGQAPLAINLFRQELADARAHDDRFAEKVALDHLGLAFWCLRDYPQAFACYEEVLTLARQVTDWQHEAEILWYLAILHAERGQRQQAIARAEAAVDLFRKLGKPQASGLEGYLQKYRAEETKGGLVGLLPSGAPQTASQPVPDAGASGPGLLRMAYSALKSMVQFVGSGCKTVSAETHRQRLQTCEGCEYYTGIRCRVCGCFTDTKAWLPHEDCPQGKWPA